MWHGAATSDLLRSAICGDVARACANPNRRACGTAHAAGYADPGRAPNYWKNYSLDEFTDRAIAEELLAILYEVYAYSGVPKLIFKTNIN